MSFDLLASHYRWMEPLLAGRNLHRCRTAHLHHLEAPQSVLILGQGPGKFLVPLQQRFSGARITCVDSSERMLTLARNRLGRLGFPLASASFIHADAIHWPAPAAAFDLIVTHFFLDCFQPDELKLLIGKLSRAAMPNAKWLISDFTVPSAGFRRLRAQAIHRLMYAFFRATTGLSARAVTPPDDLLRSNDFVLQRRVTHNLGLLHSDLWSRVVLQ